MATNSVNTGASGRIEVNLSEGTLDPANNRSYIYWTAYLYERENSPTTFGSAPGSSVTLAGGGTLWSGTFSFDWRPAGLQSTLVASGEGWHGRNPDGSITAAIGFTMGDTDTAGAGGPSYVGLSVPLAKLTTLPGVPTGVTATRVSDTQVSITWAQTSASNGAPVSNVIQRRLNNGLWEDLVTISAATSATVSVSPNQKNEYRVAGRNAAGTTAWSAASAPVYTTPAAPTGATATKNAGSDIIVSFTSRVDYPEHNHEVWHGVSVSGTITWDASALATLAAGISTYTHAAPNSSQVHVYRVRSTAGSLSSAWAQTSPVQLLAPPNKPTVPAMPAFANRASALTFSWTHNPVDTTPQKSYEFAYSTNGGSTWTTTGKVTSAVNSTTRPANSHPANTALTMRVRTWGSATTGGSDGTGASPWSDLRTVTYKTLPVASITSPTNGATLNTATLKVNVGFSQAESASFVKAQLELLQGSTLIETQESSVAVGITMATQIQNDMTYTIRARVQDSNGLWSAWASNTFSVVYLAPVPATTKVNYLPEKGFGQLDMTVDAPRVNLFTNPGFETVGAPVEVYRNLNTNPRLRGISTGWSSGPDVAFTQTPDGLQLDRAVVGGSRANLLYHTTNQPVATDDERSSSIEVSVPVGFPAVTVYLYTHGYGVETAIGESPEVTINPGQTVTLRAPSSAPIPAGVTGVRSLLRAGVAAGSVPAGARIVVRDAGLYPLLVPPPYFDGTTSPDADLTASWTGTANASASILSAASVAQVANNSTLAVAPYRTTQATPPGKFAARHVLRGTTAAAVSFGNLAPTAGVEYTLIATVRSSSPETVRLRIGSMVSADFALDGTWQTVRLVGIATGTPSSVNTGLYVSANPTRPERSSIDVMDAAIIEGRYNGDWFAGSQDTAATVSVTRSIDGKEEVLVVDYPTSPEMTLLDTTPTIHGTNTYRITTKSALGAETTITKQLVTSECRRAFLSKGPGFETVGVFGGNLSVDEDVSVASSTVTAAGRLKPIGLYGVETSVALKVKSFVYPEFGTPMDELRNLLLIPGKACYRDASGRRVFGTVKGSIEYRKAGKGEFGFTMTETS